MRRTLIDAINSKKILSLSYDGLRRVVEPHAVGMTAKGNDVLRCYQTQGGHVDAGHKWDSLDLSKMSSVSDTGQRFENARPGYKRGDKVMETIYAQL